ncbi:HAD-IA family hydrolase [Mangrovivirga sp. M17]|uniref:HAD-IA family hydrolase n=1 Tax=Mangrovivirga halotolerans TaxID=2993936 RepID=A0ABT3RNQ1_9BACT|nr:HAD-IA family hydrolase [Mangrovivirga halotolerans]
MIKDLPTYFCAMIDLPEKTGAKALIFDLDGTLADTMEVHYEAYKKVTDSYGIDFSRQLFYDWAGTPTITTFERLKEMYQLDDMDPVDCTLRKRENFKKNFHLVNRIEPVFEIVREWHGKLPMAIGTGSSRQMGMKTIETLHMTPYFDHIITVDDVSKGKPDPETFAKCALLMGVETSDCLVFEDGEPGIVAARALNMKIVDVREYLG